MAYTSAPAYAISREAIPLSEQEKSISSMAKDVLKLCRNTLLVNLRFLDAALSWLEPMELSEPTSATEGHGKSY